MSHDADRFEGHQFTVEERTGVYERLLEMAHSDVRIVAGAVIGSLAKGAGDRWSDLDVTFGLADGTDRQAVLADWTLDLAREFGAAHLFDLPRLTSIYRVFLLPNNLQVDLSFTPESDFGALGPRFTLLFGKAVERSAVPKSSAQYLFGLGAHHAVRARFCIERNRFWQAEYWISGIRDEALALACHQHDLDGSDGRGFDQLPEETLALAQPTLVRSLEREELLRALGSAVELLLHEADEVRELASKIDRRLRGLTSWM
jgi:hypothetical protein